MIYFSIKEIVSAIVSFFILGCFFGGVYNSSLILLNFFKKVLVLPIYSYKKYNRTLKSHIITRQKRKSKSFINIFDLLFILIISIFFILFSYVFLDGSIRLFSLFFFILGYILSLNFLSGYITTVLTKATDFLFSLILLLCFIVLYPAFSIINIIKKLIEPIISLVRNRLKIIKNKRIILKKSKLIEKFFI